MPATSKQERAFAEALRREGLWFVQQARCRIGDKDRLYLADFYLRLKRGAGLIVEIEGSDRTFANTDLTLIKLLRSSEYRVVSYKAEEVTKNARALARALKEKFHPETASENRKRLKGELSSIRAMLNAHSDQKRIGQSFTKRSKRK